MVKKADIGGKRLIGLAPDNWVQWITGRDDIVVQELLASDFQWIARENDVLLKAHSPQEGEFLILNELQLRYNIKMPLRMRAYAALAQEHYNLPVYPVLINILPNSSCQDIPTAYESNFMGIQVYQSYRVINLWEVQAAYVFENNFSSLLPFVPILKGGGQEDVVQRAVLELRANQQLSDLEPLLSFFASFVFDLPTVQQIMRWDMTVLRESPWYQQILKEGLTEGREQGLELGLEQGLQQGLQQGLRQGEAALVLRLLSKRFGNLDPAIAAQINRLEISQLESLGESLLDFQDIDDLHTWLAQVTPNVVN